MAIWGPDYPILNGSCGIHSPATSAGQASSLKVAVRFRERPFAAEGCRGEAPRAMVRRDGGWCAGFPVPCLRCTRVGCFVILEVWCRKLPSPRSEEHTSELQSLRHLVCRLLLEK